MAENEKSKALIGRMETLLDSERRDLARIAFRGGCAYACDGRVLARACIDHADGGEGYPFDGCDKILAANSAEGAWCAFDCGSDAYAGLEKRLAEQMRKSMADAIHERRERYTQCECPHCGMEVCYDNELDRLVELPEDDVRAVRPCDISIPVLLALPYEQKRTPIVNFGYLHMIVQAFGKDVQFAPTGGEPIAFRTPDGGVVGCLMTLRRGGGGVVDVKDALWLSYPVRDRAVEEGGAQ